MPFSVRFALLAAFLAAAGTALADDSVFVDGAFNGGWAVTFPPDMMPLGTIQFTQIGADDGRSLIDTLGDSTFASNYCPLTSEKSEFYSGSYDYSGSGHVYACTNGERLVGRYADNIGMNFGYFEINQTSPGSPPAWAGFYIQDLDPGSIYPWNAVYLGGGISSPLDTVPPDEIFLLSSTPVGGATIAAGSVQDFSALVEAKLNAHLQAVVRLVLSDSHLMKIATSTPVTLQLADGRRQYQLMIPQAQIPADGTQLFLRAEMMLPNTQVTASTPQLVYTVETSPAMQSIAPQRLVFQAGIANPGTFEQTVLVEKTGSGASLPFTAMRTSASPWLSVSPGTGTATNAVPGMVTVTVNTQGLAVGTLVGNIQITSDLGMVDVPVTVTVKGQGPVLSLDKTGFRFPVRQGQGSSLTGKVKVRNVGDAGSVVNWSARVTTGANFINVSPASGSSTTTNPSSLGITLAATATDTVGPLYGLIEISDGNAQNSPQYVTVVVDVQSANTPPTPLLSTAGFFVVGDRGGAPPASQRVTLNVSQVSTAPFTVTSMTNDGAPWLSAIPTSGSATTGNPAQLTLNFNTAGLAPGVYRGTVNVRIGGAVRGVRTTLVVRPGAAADAPFRAAGACTPTQAVLVESNLVSNFSVPAGWPAALLAQMYDDCGTPLANGSVVASFSNGDGALSLLGDQTSNEYSAMWQPGSTQSSMTVKLVGTYGTLKPDTLEIPGGVTGNSAEPPALAPGGVLNNLTFQKGAPLAPGTVAAVFGERLAAAAESVPAVPLPTSFRGVELLIGGLNAPLFYVSDSQLTVQIPFELEANRTYAAVALANGAYSVPQSVNLVPQEPGTVAFPDGKLVAQHGDYSLVSAENPARPGEVLAIYLVGMGATNPAVASGAPAPSNPSARVAVAPEVTVDGQTAEIVFAGLTAGGVGLYQVNFRVPAAAAAGELEVVIRQGDVEANVTRLVVAR